MFAIPHRNAYANGEMLGRAGRTALRRRVARLRRSLRKRRVSERLLAARLREFAGVVRNKAPRWLDEVKGMADGAGVAAEDILAVNVPPPTETPARGPVGSTSLSGRRGPVGSTSLSARRGWGCTSFVAVGRAENRLFKIRDNPTEAQAFFVNYARGTGFYQAGTDIGSIGVAHMFNARAVAGACNTGSPTAYVSDDPRLNDCHILRYFAENARCVEDVPRLFERLLEKRVAGGASATRGCIFLLADREKGLLLETHSTDYSAEFIEKGTLAVSNHYVTPKGRSWESRPPDKNTLIRRRRMEALLAKSGNPPRLERIFAMSRDRKSVPHSLCNDDRVHFWMTVSAQLQVISRDSPRDSMNYVCCGNTRHSVFIPVPLNWTENFVPLLSGRFYVSANRLYEKRACSGHFRKAQKAFEKNAMARKDSSAPFHVRCHLREAYALLRNER